MCKNSTLLPIERIEMITSLKRHILTLLAAATFTLVSQAQEVKNIAITSIVEHPALDNIRKGVQDELSENGYINNDNIKITYQSAQGSSATAAQIAKKFVAAKPDVIVAIATPSAQSLVAATKTIPIVFSGITDPVAAKLVKSWQPSKTNVTGVSDALPLDKQIDFLKTMKPDLKTVGYVYSPGEINSTTVLTTLKQELAKQGITIIGVPAQRTADVVSAARSLKGKVDLIYTTTDNNVVSAYEALVKVANESKIPLIASDPDSVIRGAIAALGSNYYNIGRQTGKVVIRILQHEKPGDIAIETLKDNILIINPTAAKHQQFEIPEAIVQSADKIIE